ncbi:MAG: hypothetical protein ACKVPX_18225 [Myxococcaceae bacterium]
MNRLWPIAMLVAGGLACGGLPPEELPIDTLIVFGDINEAATVRANGRADNDETPYRFTFILPLDGNVLPRDPGASGAGTRWDIATRFVDQHGETAEFTLSLKLEK